eukprot:m.54369 g.54369  ORF g.54369 m.54369 type:complete len:61 (-) comp9192_c0_seq1:2283-2465(-)
MRVVSSAVSTSTSTPKCSTGSPTSLTTSCHLGGWAPTMDLVRAYLATATSIHLTPFDCWA